MANITEILGTDSVSSSRPVINSNFELLNDELASITALLNPTTAVLTGLTNATVAALNVVDGSTLLSVSSSGASIGTAATFSSSVTFGAQIIKSGVIGTAAAPATGVQLTPTSITKGSYLIDGAFTLPNGSDGIEVTLINKSNAAAAVTGTLGATTIELTGLNSTVTLRCFENTWYVISSHACTIS